MTTASTHRRSLLQRLAAIDDGAIMRVAFFALLAGTAGVLYLDFTELNGAAVPVYEPQETPILPSVLRPEINPDDPAFTPTERITTDPQILGEPMKAELMPGGVLQLTGTIGEGSANAVKTEIAARGEYIKTVSLDSPGGIVTEALAIGDAIAEAGYDTEVADGALCASSCPLIFAAGEARIAGAKAVIGVHQIFTSAQTPGTAAQALSDAQMTTARITRYLDGRDVSAELWVHALETPPDRLYYFTSDELTSLKLATRIDG